MNTPQRRKRVGSPAEGDMSGLSAGIGVELSMEDKERLIENLDIEVTNHRRRFEAFLEQLLEGFSLRHGMEISRIPKAIRNMKMKDFDAFGGNVQRCVQAMARQRVAEADGDANAKKRKWQAAIQEEEIERASKTPRVAPPSPVKTSKPSSQVPNSSRAKGLFPKTPTRNMNNVNPTKTALHGSARKVMPSPSKRAVSPTKPQNMPTSSTSSFKPASTTFNPVLPPKTPTYPRRVARADEAVMSLNGTPLKFPSAFMFPRGVAPIVDEGEESEHDSHAKSTGVGPAFLVRRDPSTVSMGSSSASTAVSSTGTLITISTSKGQTVQFDPLMASPGSLDRIPDLTESAKKQVREDTARIVQALHKWRL
ncbi:SubName: Full=Uncharacterized protein {ECO:0000313/EMBL:CCA67837.1} [Serendipita indica DSM 11827]|uniref:Borealin N-terminal domain-containing protein n=1 Tax=Serendipita indica (strain DSM 11827) TaxID=1109443 RepID=G4T918_SERID|nr:SubName: Full=Uncharacterized protein {ECO:0000313/EMBL:CCA67837.1} [Serendipita indica DSM 11827]CCA67837.1 hypothetical protein PIIN_01661 [Serendipita indica DSM 11827]